MLNKKQKKYKCFDVGHDVYEFKEGVKCLRCNEKFFYNQITGSTNKIKFCHPKAPENTFQKQKYFEMVTEGDVPLNLFKGKHQMSLTKCGIKTIVKAYGEGFEFDEGLEELKESYICIKSWGGLKIKDGACLFYYFKDLHITANDAPDLSRCENMRSMFEGCKSFNGDLSQWDVSNVENMRWMFIGCESFNGDLSQWNVSNVQNMEYMFFWCRSFNGDLDMWNISNIKNKRCMFDGCKSLKKLPEWYKNT